MASAPAVTWLIAALVAWSPYPRACSAQPVKWPRAPCSWCHRLGDGLHPDPGADPPGSLYFRCRDQQLLELQSCPPGLCFSSSHPHPHPHRHRHCSNNAWGKQRRCSPCSPSPKEQGGSPCSSQGCPSPTPALWPWLRSSLSSWAPGSWDLSRGQRRRLDYKRASRWTEVNALLLFKFANRDPNGLLRSWVVPHSPTDPSFICRWHGITCRSQTGPGGAAELPLRNQTSWEATTAPPGVSEVPLSDPPSSGQLPEGSGTALADHHHRQSTEDEDQDPLVTGPVTGPVRHKDASSGLLVTGIVLANTDRTQTLWGDRDTNQSIPPEIGDLGALEVLDLSYLGSGQGDVPFGGLVGPIPRQLARCSRLSVLSLAYNALEGPLPDEIGQLASLRALNVASNRLSGWLPGTLGGLSSLISLNLRFNNFSGPIPETVSGLSRLQELSLGFSPLSGALPPGLGSLTALTHLQLSYLPLLEGALPETVSRLSRLKYFEVTAVPFTGSLPDLLPLTSLTALSITSTNITGTLPSSVPQSLSSFVLSNNLIAGPIPGALVDSLCQPGRDANLTAFHVAGNQLTGSFPVGFASCPALEDLNLSDNLLTGPFPALSDLQPLADTLGLLDVSGNRMSGTVPADALKVFSLLMAFDISNNQFTGPPPTVSCSGGSGEWEGFYFGTFTNLSHNSFEGDFSHLLRDYSSCVNATGVILDVSHNRLFGSIQQILVSDSLEKLLAGGNRLTGALPSFEGNCARLEVLDLSNNRLSGAFPDALLKGCPMLVTLDLSDNMLSGPLPPILPSRAQEAPLEPLGVRDTLPPSILPSRARQAPLDSGGKGHGAGEVEGFPQQQGLSSMLPHSSSEDLPPQTDLGGATQSEDTQSHVAKSGGVIEEDSEPWGLHLSVQLKALFLSGNQLTGPVPPGLALLKQLTILDLSRNQLQESIPRELATIPHLSRLNLSFNRLSGSIPVEIASLEFLDSLSLQANQLSGGIPPLLGSHLQGGGGQRWLAHLDVSGNLLEGGIPEGLGGLVVRGNGYVNLSSNRLSGPIPGGYYGALSHHAHLFGNPNLCGGYGYPACSWHTAWRSLPWTGLLILVFVGLLASAVGYKHFCEWNVLSGQYQSPVQVEEIELLPRRESTLTEEDQNPP